MAADLKLCCSFCTPASASPSGDGVCKHQPAALGQFSTCTFVPIVHALLSKQVNIITGFETAFRQLSTHQCDSKIMDTI